MGNSISVTTSTAGIVPPGEAVEGQAQPQADSLILGKFKSHDDLAKAYQELEKKLGSSGAAKAQTQQTPAQTEQKPGESAAGSPVVPGVDLSAYEQEYDKNGKLSEESYEKLAKQHNVPRTLVDEVINARIGKVKAFQSEVYQSVGGEETFQQMIQWAATNLPDAEKAAYDKGASSSDPDLIRLAVQSLHQKYTAAVGVNPKLVGGRAGGTGPQPFRSWNEVTRAMSDPRYDQDDAYRSDVEKRLAASQI